MTLHYMACDDARRVHCFSAASLADAIAQLRAWAVAGTRAVLYHITDDGDIVPVHTEQA